jgi:hypothetical protein
MLLLPSTTTYPGTSVYPDGGVMTNGLRRNLSPNPALATTTAGNATNWTSSPAGYTRQTGVTGMDRTTGFGGSGAIDTVTSPRFSAVAGSVYMASVQVKTGASNSFKIMINWYSGTTASGSFISATTTTAFTVNGTARCEIGPFTAPTGAGAGYVRVIDLDATTVTLTALLVEQTNASGNTYFDGGTTGASWEGTAGNSTSVLLTATDAWSFTDAGSRVATASGPVAGDATTFADTGSVVASSRADEYITWSESALIVAVSYDSRRGRIRVDALGLPLAAIRAVVERRPVNSARWSAVRGGKVAVAAGRFVRNVDDYEFAAGTANIYRIRALSSTENAPDVVVAQAVVTSSAVLDQVWLKFIANPVLNRKVQLIDWSEITRPSRSSFYDVLGRSDPVGVLDVHGSRRVTIVLRTRNRAEADDLDYALSQGLPLYLHVPETVALPSLYAAAGDISASRPSKTTQVRYWQVPLVEVAAPPASVVGAASTWQLIIDSYGSWADVLDGFDTWQDVAG